jgi:hypothetical protein
MLTHAPVLRTYDRDLKCTVVVTDASSSHEAIGAALMQDDGAGNRPVAYFSSKMNAAERNYTTREQELLAIKEYLCEWRHYLLGIPFDICSDHESLRFLNSQSELSGKLLHWNDFISMFNFGDVKYIKGMNNSVGDALSRPPLRPLQINVTDDKGELHSLVTLCDMQVASPTNNICELIQKDLLADKEFGQIYGLLTNPKYNQTTSELRLLQDGPLTSTVVDWSFDQYRCRYCQAASPDNKSSFSLDFLSCISRLRETRALVSIGSACRFLWGKHTYSHTYTP